MKILKMKSFIQFLLFLLLVCGMVVLGISNNTKRKEVKNLSVQVDSLNTAVSLKRDSIEFFIELTNMSMNAYKKVQDYSADLEKVVCRKELQNLYDSHKMSKQDFLDAITGLNEGKRKIINPLIEKEGLTPLLPENWDDEK